MASDYDYELNPPKLAKQKDLDTCWACGMSGILAANMSAHQASEDELVRKYATTKTGGMPPARLGTVANDYGYLYNAFADKTAARSLITAEFIIERLHLNGMMMAAWRIHDPVKPDEVFFHAQIVWGVIYLTKQDYKTERALLHTMNPWTAKYELWPLFWIYRDDAMPLFTCWPKSMS